MEHSYRFFENKDCKYFPYHEKDGDLNMSFLLLPALYNGALPGTIQIP